MNDNIIEFPTKFKPNAPKIVDLDAVKMQEDLNFCDNLAEGLMINLFIMLVKMVLILRRIDLLVT